MAKLGDSEIGASYIHKNEIAMKIRFRIASSNTKAIPTPTITLFYNNPKKEKKIIQVSFSLWYFLLILACQRLPARESLSNKSIH